MQCLKRTAPAGTYARSPPDALPVVLTAVTAFHCSNARREANEVMHVLVTAAFGLDIRNHP